MPLFGVGQKLACIDLDEGKSLDDNLRQRGNRKGATQLSGCEGMHFGRGGTKFGHVMRYHQSRFEGLALQNIP